MRTGLRGQLLLGEPLLVVAARLDQRVDQLVAVAGRPGRGCRPRARSRSPRRAAGAAGPRRWRGCRGRPRCRSGSAWSGRRTAPARGASRRRDVRSRACRTAIPATRAARSGSATYAGSPSSSISLKENGTVIRRPSNSGTAIWVAASSGETPSSFSSQAARGLVRQSAWRIGHVEAGERARVPGLVVAAGRGLGGLGAARREDGGDDGVGGAQLVDQLGLGGAQGGDVERERPGRPRPRSRRTGRPRSAVLPLMWWAR